MSNMVVRTNIYSLNAHRNMKNVGLEQRRAANRLSSGFRINSAADDAAGLAISETMRAQIRGLDQASRNAQDGQAMILTTEGGLEEIGNILQRVRELLVQAANDTNTQLQRTMIEQEIAQLGQEIHGMQTRVEFNTNQVLNIGFHGEIRISIAEAQIEFATAQEAVANASMIFAQEVGAARITFAEQRNLAIERYSDARRLARDNFNTEMARAAAAGAVTGPMGGPDIMNYLIAAARAEYAAARVAATAERTRAIAVESENLAIRLRDVKEALQAERDIFAGETHRFIGSLRTQLFAISEDIELGDGRGTGLAWFQVGANSAQGITFDFATVSRAVLASAYLVEGIADALVVAGSIPESGIGFGSDLSFKIDAVGEALNAINEVRANLGAVQNRMDYTMRSLDISSENLQDSESRVRNADIAREMMRFTMTNVLQQAAVSMLAQANQLPQNLLQLLR